MRKNVPAEAQQEQVAAYNVLKLVFPAPVGTVYYSDTARTAPWAASGRVVDWGTLDAPAAERTITSTDVSIELSDPAAELRGWFATHSPRNVQATLFQCFGPSAALPLAIGRVGEPLEWNEESATLRFDIVDPWMAKARTACTLVPREDFPEVADRDDGAPLPLVFGRIQSSRPIALRFGPVTSLALGCGTYATRLILADGSHFPQDTQIDLMVDREIVRGTLHGNSFTVALRGVKWLASVTTGSAQPGYLLDTHLPSTTDDAYRGWSVSLTLPSGDVDFRGIIRYEATTHTLVLSHPFYTAYFDSPEGGVIWNIPVGTPYQIATIPALHQTGARVRLRTENVVYVVNDAPSKKVQAVEVWGEHRDPSWSFVVGGVVWWPTTGHEEWMDLDATAYAVNLNDTTTFPALGHAVTTITMSMAPSELDGRASSDDIRVTLWGVETAVNSTGQLITNPAEAVRWLLLNRMGLTLADLDDSSFAVAKNDTRDLTVAFCLRTTVDVAGVAADLAWQGRCRLTLEAGLARCYHMRNKPSAATPVLTVAVAKRADGGLSLEWLPPAEVYTEAVARMVRRDETEQRVVIRDLAAEAAYGRRTMEVNLWAYQSERCAKRVLSFLLGRSCRVWRAARLRTFLTALGLERGDVVVLDAPGTFTSGQRAWVEAVSFEVGNAQARRMDAIDLHLRLPLADGCGSGPCEAACETGGAEYACESGETDCADACETSCQDACELGCTTAYQSGNCFDSDQVPCDTTATETGCGACESVCQLDETEPPCYFSTTETGSCAGCAPSETESGCPGESCSCQTWACQGGETCWGSCEGGSCMSGCQGGSESCWSCQAGCQGEETCGASEACGAAESCGATESCGWDEACGATEPCGLSEACPATEPCGWAETCGYTEPCGQDEVCGVTETGCATSCETGCETSSCESSCESDNMTGPCICCDYETPEQMWLTVSGLGGDYCAGQGGTYLAGWTGVPCDSAVSWMYADALYAITLTCHVIAPDQLWGASYSGPGEPACGCEWEKMGSGCAGGSMGAGDRTAGTCMAGGGGGAITWLPAY